MLQCGWFAASLFVPVSLTAASLLHGGQPHGREFLNWAADDTLFTAGGKIVPGKELPTNVIPNSQRHLPLPLPSNVLTLTGRFAKA